MKASQPSRCIFIHLTLFKVGLLLGKSSEKKFIKDFGTTQLGEECRYYCPVQAVCIGNGKLPPPIAERRCKVLCDTPAFKYSSMTAFVPSSGRDIYEQS